jgi:transcription initiation factor TFIID subunit 2
MPPAASYLLCFPHSPSASCCCFPHLVQLLSADGKKKTFHYTLNVPTAAPCIAFVIGSFEVYPDPVMQEVTHFCLPGLLPILKNTVQFVHEVFGFFEELLSTRFPHSSYKLVFVDQTYQDTSSYSTLTICNTNLLHSNRVIDQVTVTRRLLTRAIAQQYFGCYLLPQLWNDWWLPCGIAGFITGLFCRKISGSTEYQHWIMEEVQRVCQYESEHTLPPLCGTLQVTSASSSSSSSSGPGGPRASIHPQLVSERELAVLMSKAHLILRSIQLKIGHDLLMQVFHKQLTLASTASQFSDFAHWHNLIISTAGLMKSIQTVSGKDLSHFMEQWVCRNGVPRFHVSFSYMRKKNYVELRLKQDLPRGYSKFVGPMTVVVQEFDGNFSHTIQVEDISTTHELPCHSKIRKSKKRKVPLSHGEEVDIDVSSLDMEVPVLWLRVDPEFQWLRQLSVEQPDTVWHSMLKYERDAVAQVEAMEALEEFPSSTSRDLLRESILNTQFYYKVRVQAAHSLAKLITDTASSGGSPGFLVSVFQKLYGSQAHPTIVRYNDFSDIAAYFVQKAIIQSVAGVRNMHKQCPKEVLSFLWDLFKYSDNQINKYSDGYYFSTLVHSLALTVTPKVAVVPAPLGLDVAKVPVAIMTTESQAILQEIVQGLNIEKVLPSYKYSVTASCLAGLRVLQKNGHLPTDSSLFREYASKDKFMDVRLAALKALVDIVQAEHSEGDMKFLLDIVENDISAVRLWVLQMLASNPPFTRKTESKLNTLTLVERMWSLICVKFSHDSRLRNAAVEVYSALYGRLTPTCLPQGLSVVIDLKEKVARSSLASPALVYTPHTISSTTTYSSCSNVLYVSQSPKTLSATDDSRPKTISPTPPVSGLLQLNSTPSPVIPQIKAEPMDTSPAPPSAAITTSGGSTSTGSTSVKSLSLKIPTSHLKRPLLLSTHEGGEFPTPSPEPGAPSEGSPSPYPSKHKKRKSEHKHKKKNKHKQKHKHRS